MTRGRPAVAIVLGVGLLVGVTLGVLACRRDRAASSATPSLDALELVESAPVETTLNHPDVRDAADVWPEMIGRARATLDVAQFYVSDAPNGRLGPVLDAIEAAADRGVRVRLLVERAFVAQYPDTLERLKKRVELRVFDLRALTPPRKGILHAKYFVVDGREAFVGSQNFDWRALEHIQEIGVRLSSPVLATRLGALFSSDWDVAGGASPSRWSTAFGPASAATSASTVRNGAGVATTADGAGVATTADGERVEVLASPRFALPDDASWDLPRLLERLDRATKTVDVQVLTYHARMRDGAPWTTLDDALRRAAQRGVRVRLLVSHWGAKDEALAALARDLGDRAQVRVLTIPRASVGEIPFARVAHAKYAVFDGAAAWVGTSNWEGDYFLESRNVSVFVDGAAFARRLAGVFDDGWGSAYAAPLGASAAALAAVSVPSSSAPASSASASGSP